MSAGAGGCGGRGGGQARPARRRTAAVAAGGISAQFQVGRGVRAVRDPDAACTVHPSRLPALTPPARLPLPQGAAGGYCGQGYDTCV